MNKIIFVVLLVISIKTIAQDKISFTVNYVLKVNKEMLLEQEKKGDGKFPEVLLMHLKNFEEPSATLVFNNTNSYYKVDDKLENDKHYKFNFFTERAGGKSEYFCDLTQNNCSYTSTIIKNKSVIYTKKTWILTEETETILGYICRKAILKNDKEATIEAWFTQDLPFPFGPFKFNNLPGLILKVETNNGLITYLATEIKENKNHKIKKDESIEAIQEDEYKQLIKSKNSIFEE